MSSKEVTQRRVQFVKDNVELIREAIKDQDAEITTFRTPKRQNIIRLARTHLGYSPRTISYDIWNRLMKDYYRIFEKINF